ncbi:hypothetical protein NWP16_02520 [Chrysosporum ovalisporum FSS-45]|uniref:hypothetical protein n=1 Tax=Umezakia ovalisporum TaxID=75695 RepID=UPI002475560D|nr:hypothetical protein [Umezakia ovalisporum]MDH6076755.1 hypothetical protein [Umezakia ovalisporum FSS-45]
MLNFISKLREVNPQFVREIKGRLKITNLFLSISVSVLGQLIFLLIFQGKLPPSDVTLPYGHLYCTGQSSECVLNDYDNVIINWQLWYQDAFHGLSLLGIFVILVVGTYLIINDLATEKMRNTLNFIRLSPQTPQSILFGKILGVPILLYVLILLAIPLHLWLGLQAKIPLNQIFIFYVIVIFSTFSYYSGALLFGLIASWLGGFQSWLGSGFLLVFLAYTWQGLKDIRLFDGFVFLKLITPIYFIPEFSASSQFPGFRWFQLPLGNSFVNTSVLSLLVYLIGIYFIWQSLERCYLDSNATMLSKGQSYLLTTIFAIITLGCFNWHDSVDKVENIKDYLFSAMFLYFWLFLYLIASLTQNRQTLQDWARYQHIYRAKHPAKQNLIKDLIWGEKSPGVLAIAINGLIAVCSLSTLLLMPVVPVSYDKLYGFAALIFAFSLVVIYGALAQLLLFMKNPRRLLWANSIVGAVIFLPPIVSLMLFYNSGNLTFLWFFSIFAPLPFLYPEMTNSSDIMTPLLAILGQLCILSLLLFQIKRQLGKAGESATKALLVNDH